MKTMRWILILFWTIYSLITVSVGDADEPFPPASPASQGLSSSDLRGLAEVVRGFVEEDEVVGAELLVIKNRRTVLHEVYGWKDRESGALMTPDSLFNIRSMTKPITGTLALMLVEEGKLSLNDPVSKYLPSFADGESSRITVRQLMTHRSGLPLTVLTPEIWEKLDSLRSLAETAGERGPETEPGSAFQYSDAGSDTLGAVLEVAGGGSLDELRQRYIFDRLHMTDTVSHLKLEDPRRRNTPTLYFGGKGEWAPIQRPGGQFLYRFPMGSQSVYSTAKDYARFLAFWMDHCRIEGKPLLSSGLVNQALHPVSEMPYIQGFHGLKVHYGQMWMIWVPVDREEADSAALPVMFGHGGSDGTWAAAWPGQDLMVLYFTQSRGQATVTTLEPAIDRALINPQAYALERVIARGLEKYVGTYVIPSIPYEGAAFRIVDRDGNLALQPPRNVPLDLRGPDDQGAWHLALDPDIWVSFRTGDSGAVSGMEFHQGEIRLDLQRGETVDVPLLEEAASRRFLGFYRHDESGDVVEVVFRDGQLVILKKDAPVPIELYPPDARGMRHLKLSPMVKIRFDENPDGEILSYTSYGPDDQKGIQRRKVASKDGNG